MKHTKIFFALCCAAAMFVACDKNDEPNNNQNKETTDTENNNDPKNDTKEAVDLGLSVKWATCNVGATSPEKYGNYYAWGETEPKTKYNFTTYKYGDGTTFSFSKYNSADGKEVLDLEDDAARVNWGGSWRMPTAAEFEELLNNCTWIYNESNGGYTVQGSNGNTIFLPAAGYRYYDDPYGTDDCGSYWSSSLYPDGSSLAWDAVFCSLFVNRDYNYRYYGQSVRPVCE